VFLDHVVDLLFIILIVHYPLLFVEYVYYPFLFISSVFQLSVLVIQFDLIMIVFVVFVMFDNHLTLSCYLKLILLFDFDI
jgi:hypothetical protein